MKKDSFTYKPIEKALSKTKKTENKHTVNKKINENILLYGQLSIKTAKNNSIVENLSCEKRHYKKSKHFKIHKVIRNRKQPEILSEKDYKTIQKAIRKRKNQ